VKKLTTSSSEKNTISLKTHENHKKTSRTVQEHFNILREKIEFQKNDNIESISCDSIEGSFSFFVSSLSLSSSAARQSAFMKHDDLSDSEF
jgi:hypothetical protein